MRITVLVKPILDISRTDIISRDVLPRANLKINDVDKSALELALKLKNQLGGEVIVISALTWFCSETRRIREVAKLLRETLALGADKAIMVKGSDLCIGDHRITAEALLEAIKRSGPYDLILCGEGSSDIFSQVVPVLIASKLNIPFIGLVKDMKISSNKVIADLKLDNVVMSIEVELPVVASVAKEIATPRLPTLIDLKRAYKKPIDIIDFSRKCLTRDIEIIDFKVVSEARKQLIKVHASPNEMATELINVLKELHVVNA
ncbi:MAG: hypothetical protein DRO15_05040 [Thermoprotei archaeon]|nr:MAG: hypothetical protein DRO15_05040 [Thermoprotei archaeon]